jgi:hypothetical protein
MLKIGLPLLIWLGLVACVPGGDAYAPEGPAGFFSGVWHGWIAPVCLVWGFFDPAVRIYEVYNTGWWYDFGYYIANISDFGGFFLLRSRGD